MSSRIEREFDFQACIHFLDQFMMNEYRFKLLIEIQTESPREQNIAMERLKYLIYESFDNSIFVHADETDAIEKYSNAGLKVCIIPEEPFDQIIAFLILSKANAVCEEKLKATDIMLSSRLSDQVKFLEQIEVASNVLPNDGWWMNNDPNLSSKSQIKMGNVVELVKDQWSDLDLSWKEKNSESTEVLFTNHKNDK